MNPSLGRIKYFTGRHDGTSFVGTWYSNLGEQGDWKFSPQYQDSLNSCQSILQAGFSTGDGQYTIQTDSNESVTVYCDMTTDGGGWTLVGSFPKNHAGGIKSLTDYGSIPATSDFNPSVLWMYQGGLSHFSDAREQVACSQSQCTDGKSVYGVNMSTVELENVRLSWAHEDKMIAVPQRTDIPTCRTSLNDATTTFEGCTNPAYVNMVNTPTLLGWQNDVNGRYCWAARGTYKPNSVGSSLCNSSEPNGTKSALLWMR
ncbi:hypothetical protein CWC18_16520 [Pseudoalteromonas aurantia]|uniref:Fibrinogen C-terminal domain-containing protein n=1 Tax=Pseudoalteromonas aurantia TaxID=43654 RepID=A0A5S3V3E3_9GAMM|nr:hypothetical protein CWC18_16520 [Pseudoalteromonas aurantia]TMO65454.1 hypothetical protein CWC19_17520 [Pseudoalteromonas aurantia]TMO71532.1 hypothetical protein CWC20_17365 [Pseudoalteromonas aurantia]